MHRRINARKRKKKNSKSLRSFVRIRDVESPLNDSEDGRVKKKCLERMKPIIPPSCLQNSTYCSLYTQHMDYCGCFISNDVELLRENNPCLHLLAPFVICKHCKKTEVSNEQAYCKFFGHKNSFWNKFEVNRPVESSN